MERRALLKGLMVGIPATASAVAGAAVKSGAYVRESSEQSMDSLKSQVDALRKRIDESDASTKKMLKTLCALTALSLGIDVSSLL
jgi:hypothetical protein